MRRFHLQVKPLLNWALCSGIVLLHLTGFAADLAGSGNRLQMMQKIQGSWQNRCETIAHQPKEVFAFTKLKIDFQTLQVERKIYLDSQCLRERDNKVQRYRYLLGNPTLTKNGEAVFELGLQLQGDDNTGGSWHPLNLIKYQDGKLFFGLWSNEERNQRLNQLDKRNPFVR